MTLCSPRACSCVMAPTSNFTVTGAGGLSDPFVVEMAPPQFGSREKSARLFPTATGTTVSAVYVDWPPVGVGGPLTTTFVKQSAATLLVVDMKVQAHLDSGTVKATQFAVNIDGVDTMVINGHCNQPHPRTMFGVVEVAGLAAGTRTLKLRARIVGGGVLGCGASSTFSWTLRERAVGP